MQQRFLCLKSAKQRPYTCNVCIKEFHVKKSPKFLPFFSHSSSDISDWMGLSGAFFFFFLAGMVLGTPNTGGEPGNVQENHLIWEEESKNNLLPRTDKFKLNVNKVFFRQNSRFAQCSRSAANATFRLLRHIYEPESISCKLGD